MILEGTCGSSATLDCNGFSVQNNCCEGHLLTGETVGPDVRTCNWMYGNHGEPIQCPKSDKGVTVVQDKLQLAQMINLMEFYVVN